jgi:uncharacterized protein (TIGR02118 family)
MKERRMDARRRVDPLSPRTTATMLKTLGFLPRRRDLNRADFREYYERRHAPLALSHVHAFLKYVRNHVADGAAPDAPFDTVSEFWYESPESAAAVGKWLHTPAGQVLRDDEERFMDRSRIGACVSEEHLLRGPARECEPGPVRKLGFVIAPADPRAHRAPVEIKAACERLLERHGGLARRALLDVPVSPLPAHVAVEAILWIWPIDASQVASALGGQPGASLIAFDAIETPPDALRG